MGVDRTPQQEVQVPDITQPAIENYATEHTSPEPRHLVELAASTRDASDSPQMMVGRLEGRFLKMLVAISRATSVLEIGTFTGYSALSMAEALPAGGRITTCELDARHAALARTAVAASPYAEAIEIREGPAIRTIAQLDGPFDMAFIDADKGSYRDYYEAALPKMAPGGLICVDNVLWSGRVLDTASDDPDTRAIQDFNDHVAADPRVECVIVPIRDGVTLIRVLPGAGG